MDKDTVKSIDRLLKDGAGDAVRLERIRNLLQDGKALDGPDRSYLDHVLKERQTDIPAAAKEERPKKEDDCGGGGEEKPSDQDEPRKNEKPARTNAPSRQPAAESSDASHSYSSSTADNVSGIPFSPMRSISRLAQISLIVSTPFLIMYSIVVHIAAQTIAKWVLFGPVIDDGVTRNEFHFDLWLSSPPFVILAVAEIAATVFFLIWFHRAYRNLQAFGAKDLPFSSRRAVLYFFIPFFNCYKPYVAAREIWKGSEPAAGATDRSARKRMKTSLLINGWWASVVVFMLIFGLFWLEIFFIDVIGGGLPIFDSTVDCYGINEENRISSKCIAIDSFPIWDFAAFYSVSVIAISSLAVILNLLTVVLVRKISSRQSERFLAKGRRGGAGQTDKLE